MKEDILNFRKLFSDKTRKKKKEYDTSSLALAQHYSCIPRRIVLLTAFVLDVK